MSGGRSGTAGAAALLCLFLGLQLLSVGFGTRINNVPHVAEAVVDPAVARGSSLQRDTVVAPTQTERESLDLWNLRFKLYSVESDEVINLMALARIDPRRGRFDPGFYQYGGAYLYPLGFWFYALDRLSLIDVGPLEQMLADPERMDAVWIYGRVFVLLAFSGSAALLWLTLRHAADTRTALVLLAIYFATPATVMFSQVMKPHWYALLWVNAALLFLVGAARRRQLLVRDELGAGIGIGLAVGSALTFSLFSILCWAGLCGLVWRRVAPFWSLVRVPAVAVIVFATTNPYYFLNWQGVAAESAVLTGWFQPSLDPATMSQLVENALFGGFGVALSLLVIALAAWRLTVSPRPGDRLLALAAVFPLATVAIITANMASWHVNIRFASYMLPVWLLFLALREWPCRLPVLAAVLVATALQAVPMKLAYLDENDPAHSTRLRAAAWVDSNIPEGETVCVNSLTPAPYEVPPFRLDRYRLNVPGCDWKVLFERETDSVAVDPAYQLVNRFRPRLSPEAFPLVFGHINPQISIYRRG